MDTSDTRRKPWIKALRQFEKVRVTSGYSVESMFAALNPRDTDALPLAEFAQNMSYYCGMDYNDAILLGKSFDSKRRQCISIEDIKRFLLKEKEQTSIENLLEDHFLFPKWLAGRSDFQAYFSEWNVENGAPNIILVEAALLLPPERRKPGDLQILYKWVKLHKVLTNVRDGRLLDVCRSIQFVECPRAGVDIVVQGEDGDSFYIVLDGRLDVIINGIVVGSMSSGMSFGEKALENDAPRAATVRAKTPCKLMTLRAAEYKNLVATAQAKTNQEIVEFLHSRCPFFGKVSHARLSYMVKAMVRRAFRPGEIIQLQGDPAGCLCIIMSGKVSIRKLVRKGGGADIEEDSLQCLNSRATVEEDADLLVHIDDVGLGCILGDEAALETEVAYSYGAVARLASEVIVVNRKELRRYLDAHILSMRALVQHTCMFHRDDAILVRKHYDAVKKTHYLDTLKKGVLGLSYAGKFDKSADSRLLSTKSLEQQQERARGIQEQAKYQRSAITATLNMQAKAKPSRRSSMVSLLL